MKGGPRDDLLWCEILGTLVEAQPLIEQWRQHDYTYSRIQYWITDLLLQER